MVWHPAAKQLEIIAELSNAQTFPAKPASLPEAKFEALVERRAEAAVATFKG